MGRYCIGFTLIINGGKAFGIELKYHRAKLWDCLCLGKPFPFDSRDYEIDKKSNLKTLPCFRKWNN